MSLSLERHSTGIWRVVVDGKPMKLGAWFMDIGSGVAFDDLPFIYRLLDEVARPEFGVPPRREGASPPLGLFVQDGKIEPVCNGEESKRRAESQGVSLAKELNLDVQAEQARALHRVIRAMHDGHCPNCGHLSSAGNFEQRWARGSEPTVVYHVCPRCEFTITDKEATDGLAEFAPFLKKSVELFKEWRRERSRSIADKIVDGFQEFAGDIASGKHDSIVSGCSQVADSMKED